MNLNVFELAAADPAIRFSPHCWRTRMAIAHKGLEANFQPWRFTEKERIAASGQGLVPVLVDGKAWVADSGSIADHLDRHYPDRPLFDSPQSRAHARFIETWVSRVLHPGILRQIIGDLFTLIDEGDKAYFRESREKRFGTRLESLSEAADAALPALRATLDPLRATLEGQAYFGGETSSYADYAVFGAFQWARVSSPKELLEPGDPIAAWRDRMLDAFGGVARAMPARNAK